MQIRHSAFPLSEVQFRGCARQKPTAVRWIGSTPSGKPVSGRLSIHTTVASDRLLVWATVERDRSAVRTADDIDVTAERRLTEIATRTRELMQCMHEQAATGWNEVLRALARIVTLAEQDIEVSDSDDPPLQ